MDPIYLDIRAGEGLRENLAALVAEGYEIAAAHEGLVVMRRAGRRFVSAPKPAPVEPAPVEPTKE